MGKMKKFEVLNLICKDCELTAKEKLVAQYFVYKSNKAGACYPCVDVIAEQCSVSRRTVQRATKKLAEKEYILIEKRFKFGRQTSNLYSFNILLLEERRRNEELDRQATNDMEEQETCNEEIEMEVVEFEELFNIEQDEEIIESDTQVEEIDLDELIESVEGEDWVLSGLEQDVNEHVKATKLEEYDSLVSDNLERSTAGQILFYSVTRMLILSIFRMYSLGKSDCNIISVEKIFLHIGKAKEDNDDIIDMISRASSNIMGAFFPP